MGSIVNSRNVMIGAWALVGMTGIAMARGPVETCPNCGHTFSHRSASRAEGDRGGNHAPRRARSIELGDGAGVHLFRAAPGGHGFTFVTPRAGEGVRARGDAPRAHVRIIGPDGHVKSLRLPSPGAEGHAGPRVFFHSQGGGAAGGHGRSSGGQVRLFAPDGGATERRSPRIHEDGGHFKIEIAPEHRGPGGRRSQAAPEGSGADEPGAQWKEVPVRVEPAMQSGAERRRGGAV